jgi:hypothetical protein
MPADVMQSHSCYYYRRCMHTIWGNPGSLHWLTGLEPASGTSLNSRAVLHQVPRYLLMYLRYGGTRALLRRVLAPGFVSDSTDSTLAEHTDLSHLSPVPCVPTCLRAYEHIPAYQFQAQTPPANTLHPRACLRVHQRRAGARDAAARGSLLGHPIRTSPGNVEVRL